VTIYRSAAALSAGTVTPAGTLAVPVGAAVIGVSLGHRELAEADHWILSLLPAPVLACTHLVREPFPHVAISLVGAASTASPATASPATGPTTTGPTTTGPAAAVPEAAAGGSGGSLAALPGVDAALEAQPALRAAADLAAAGQSGRAVIFPGVASLVGTLSVADVLALSAIDRIEILGGEVPDPDALVETNDFIRPQYRAGQLVLTAMPAADGRLVPFESRTPTPCCAAH